MRVLYAKRTNSYCFESVCACVYMCVYACVHVCVCMWEKERERERKRAYVRGTGADERFVAKKNPKRGLETRVGLSRSSRSDDDEKTVREDDKYVYGST